MMIQLELWHLISLLVSFLAAMGAFGRVLLAQFEKRMADRFAAQDQLRNELHKVTLQTIQSSEQLLRQLERDHLNLKAELPREYWRREDAIREYTVMHAKLDALAGKIDSINNRGATA
ncbi:hypothetical protein [Cupriavidus metallidurans]|uniref:Uncharacterized protein n=1 Tax=Cupriavidus metallidurans TaxID=119219 RepID=A0A482IRU6_9BURK|nr:hypothetical protein [Cupriavidus metallidurans]QBP09839.1 hypothetical protein DDF84_008730 [Cupriavidus metallidurans]